MKQVARKSRIWWLHAPGWSMAETREFTEPVTERDVREAMRDSWGLSRLPAGLEIWPYTSAPVPGPMSAQMYFM